MASGGKRKQNTSPRNRRTSAAPSRGGGGKRDVRREAAEHLARQRRLEARRRAYIGAGIALVVVLAAVGVLIGLKVSSGNNSNTANGPTPTGSASAPSAAPSALISEVTGVPAATLDTIGKGSGVSAPTTTSGQAVATANGKPLVFYYGAEFCPFCAAERWPLIVALSRFGTFSGLSTINSSEDNVPTFTFVGSTYTSNYITFSPKEVEGQQGEALDTLTSQETGMVNQFNPQKSFPFVSFANQAVVVGASYSNSILMGKTQDDVASALADPSTDIAKSIGGTANAFTAQICKLTNNQPANVCSSAAVKAWNGG